MADKVVQPKPTPPLEMFVPWAALGNGVGVRWIWDGYLARGHITLLAGLPKAGKTTLFTHLLRVAEAGGTLGSAVKASRVLVVTEESGTLWAMRRERMGVKGEHVRFCVRPFVTRPSQDRWESWMHDVGCAAAEHRADFVVFDTLAALSPCDDENNAAKMQTALMPLLLLAGLDVGVLLVHHLRKGDAGEGQRSRGSSALTGFVDIVVELRRGAAFRDRILKAYSRFDETPQEQVLTLHDHGHYAAPGVSYDAARQKRMRTIVQILMESGELLSVEDIGERWPDEQERPAGRTLRRDLQLGVNQEMWVTTGQHTHLRYQMTDFGNGHT